LKRGGGVGGGNVPTAGYGKPQERKNIRSSSDNARNGSPSQPKGIRALIVDHLKSKIQTTDDAQKFLSNLSVKNKAPQVEVFDVLSKYRKEEVNQYLERQDPEYQAIASRDGVSSNGFNVSKVGQPIPGGAGMIGLQENPKNDIDDMFQFEEVGAGD